jgi:hypothetical protein
MGVDIIECQGYQDNFGVFFMDDNFRGLLRFNNHLNHLEVTYRVINLYMDDFFLRVISTIEVVVI